MANRIFNLLLSLCLLVPGFSFLGGGYLSERHGLYFDFGKYNFWVGVGFFVLSALVFWFGFFARDKVDGEDK